MKDEKDELIMAFVQGAMWWEFEKTEATMWQSDQGKAEQEAIKRLNNGTLGKERFPRQDAWDNEDDETEEEKI